LIPLIPLALLPPKISSAILFVLSLLALIFFIFKLGARPLVMLAILFSYPVAAGLYFGSLEPFFYLGFILPPQIGLFFLLAKPQIGIGVAVYWLYLKIREGKVSVLKTFTPVVVAYVLSILIFGPWFLSSPHAAQHVWNLSLWPYAIPVGLGLMAASLYYKLPGLALASAPFLSPYVAPQSWAVFILGILPKQLPPVIISLAVWVIILLIILT
jgi:hypothetical protein